MGAAGVGLSQRLTQETREVERLKQEVKRNQEQASALEARNQELGQQLTALQGERKGLNDRIAGLTAQAASATSDLEQSRASLDELRGQNDQLSAERTQLQEQVTDTITEREHIRKRLQALEEENGELKDTAGRVRERMMLLERDYQQLQDKLASGEASPAADATASITTTVDPSATTAPPSSVSGVVELPPIVVRPEQADSSAAVRARVMEVNDPQGFVVIDRGSAEGVRMGMAFEILRGVQAVGRATAVRVRPHLSACDIAHPQTAVPLQVGDVAVQSQK